jgi:hypothetical protein
MEQDSYANFVFAKKDESQSIRIKTPLSCVLCARTPVSQCICFDISPHLALLFVLPETTLITEWLGIG